MEVPLVLGRTVIGVSEVLVEILTEVSKVLDGTFIEISEVLNENLMAVS
jgi:hypothetical protein